MSDLKAASLRNLRKASKLSRLLVHTPFRRALLQHGVAAGLEHIAALRTLQCATVLDLGANVGQFTLAARSCFPDAHIIAFEPLRRPTDVFRTLFAADPKVRLHNVAVGPRSERIAMHVSAKDDSSSILPITQNQTTVFPGTEEAAQEEIQVEPLASVVDVRDIVRPALLKLDVQGFELQALEGCAGALACVDYVYVECSFVELYQGQSLADEVIVYLRDRDFAVAGIYNVTYDASGRCIQADFLFARRQPAPARDRAERT